MNSFFKGFLLLVASRSRARQVFSFGYNDLNSQEIFLDSPIFSG
jgi:hypothetical protein